MKKDREFSCSLSFSVGANCVRLRAFTERPYEDDFLSVVKPALWKAPLEKLFIGGQVSRAWDLMKPGFETTCPISYVLSEDPSKCPIWGIKYCAERGMDGIYKEGKEQ